jgi:hypothetical protein
MPKKKYKKGAQKHEDGMVHLDGKANMLERLNLARDYAKSGQPDTAFYHLGRVIDGFKYTELDKIKDDSLLTVLQKHKKWPLMEKNLLALKAEIEKDYDWEIFNQLAEIERKDQEGRNQTAMVEVKYGRDSEELEKLEKLWDDINTQDSLNMLAAGIILDERGWLGPDIIGEEGSAILFLVIQHANLEYQLKYLPMMRKAVEKKYADGGSLAMLEDRVALHQKKNKLTVVKSGALRKLVNSMCFL